jgi:hypothetical protein
VNGEIDYIITSNGLTVHRVPKGDGSNASLAVDKWVEEVPPLTVPLPAAESLTAALSVAIPGVGFFIDFYDSARPGSSLAAVSSLSVVETAASRFGDELLQQMKANIKVAASPHTAYELPIVRFQVRWLA